MEYIFPLIILFLDIAMIVKIARSDEPGKLWWILLILFLPILGPLIFIGISNSHERRMRSMQAYDRSRGLDRPAHA